MTLDLLAATVPAAAPTRLDPVELFLQADIIVQAVMVGLLFLTQCLHRAILGRDV